MNRRPLLLAYLILVGTTLLILAVAASIHPQPVAAQPAPVVNQSVVHAPLYTAAPIWSNVPLTDPSLNATLLTDVTVDSAGTVWAVGFSGSNLVVISSTNAGTSWFTSTQNLGVSSELLGIAAVSPTNIFAVGDYVPTSGADEKTLVLHYNGGSWSPVTSASFSGYDVRLTAVAATPSGDVWAVGRTQASGGGPSGQ